MIEDQLKEIFKAFKIWLHGEAVAKEKTQEPIDDANNVNNKE